MSTRKNFLGAAASLGAAIAASRSGAAATGASPAPSASMAPQRPPSDAARAFAARMRKFDAKLSDAELDGIARGIDDEWSSGSRINAKGNVLRNSDEPDPPFSVKA